ncbi:MAG: mechanosensitive ion channel family protein [Bacteroidales bacterium]|jgi:small-conductance mechanosensitive channel|nr:mechanosensitive ion channel family protein [Bacteroidales bacterium]
MRDYWLILAIVLLSWQTAVGQEEAVTATSDDSAFVDNSAAVELMRHVQEVNISSNAREAVLTEQLRQTADSRQRLELHRRLQQFLVADSLRKDVMSRQIDSLKRTSTGAPVMLDEDTVLMIYTRWGAFTPAERAERSSEKLRQVATVFIPEVDSLFIIDSGSTHDIMFNETTLTSISDLDAMWMNESRYDLAARYKPLFLAAINRYRADMTVSNIVRQISLSILLIFCLCIAIYGVNCLFFRVIDKKIVALKGRILRGIRIRNLEIIDADKQVQSVLFLSKAIRYIIYFLLLYITLPLLFSIYPMTERLADTLFRWIWTPAKAIIKSFITFIPNLLKILLIVIIIRYILRWIKYLMTGIESGRLNIPGFYPDWAHATYNIIRLFLIAFSLVMIFPLLPSSDSKTFQGISVFMGVIFSLGSTTVIGNMMAGLVITYMRSFKIGDRIRVGDVFGDVIEKTPFVIRVKTIKMEVITVPNLTVLSSNVINYSTSTGIDDDGVILYTTITMGYEVPRETVISLLIQAALKTKDILPQPTPFVLQTGLGDYSASYQINAYTKHPERQAVIYSELHLNIQDLFLAAGIEMIIPHYRAVRDGNPSTLPKQSA